jgi:hypothetical protein
MHLFYENIMRTALKTLLGEDMKSPREYELKKLNKVVSYVNKAFSSKRALPKDLFVDLKKGTSMPYLKAVAWKDLLELFPRLFQAMESKPSRDMKSIVLELTIIMRIMSRQEITEKELKLLDETIPRFFDEFKRELSFDSRKHIMVKKMTLPIHMLLHMTEYIRQTGPPRHHWAFAMERTCKTVKELTTAFKEPSIARSNKLGWNLLAHIGDIKEVFEQKASANMPKGSKSVLRVSEISTEDRTAVQKYVQEKLGITDYNYDQSNTDFLKRVTRNGVEYARDETKPERSKICFQEHGGMRYGRTRAIVKLRANQQTQTFFILNKYNQQDVQYRNIKSRVLIPGESIKIAAFLTDGRGPTGADQVVPLVVPFEEVLSPISLIHDPTYNETKTYTRRSTPTPKIASIAKTATATAATFRSNYSLINCIFLRSLMHFVLGLYSIFVNILI